MNAFKAALLFLMVPFFVFGCAGTQQVSRQIELKSHFLGPEIVSKLKEGGDDQAGLVYQNPNARWASYDKVMVDPVQIWKDEGTKDVEPEDLQRLANDLWSKLRESLAKDYQIVSQPGAGVMRFSAAITEAEASNPALDAVTSVIPQTRILTGLKGMAAGGKPGFVGAASAEAKITDGKTGELLIAAIDRRAGTKSISGSTSEWGDIEDAYQYWADKVRWRLCELREGEGSPSCKEVKPKA